MDPFKFIEPDQAIDKISNERSIVVDIRDKDSFDQGHIDGALNLSNNNIDNFVLDTGKNGDNLYSYRSKSKRTNRTHFSFWRWSTYF